MLGLTPIGVVHTLISLVAVAAGAVALIRSREIAPHTVTGQVYIWATLLTCLTGFFIFQHGGFGKPHALGVLTLGVLGVAWAAGSRQVFGAWSRMLEMLSYSLTFFFHMVPGITEPATRLPFGAPWAASPEDPKLQTVIGVVFLLFLIGAALQVRWLRGQSSSTAITGSVRAG